MYARLPVVSAVLAILVLSAGCENAVVEDPTTTQLGKCSCVCRVDQTGSSAAWGATFVGSPAAKACVDVCGAYEAKLVNRSCRPEFTGKYADLAPRTTAFAGDSDYDGVPDGQDRCPNESGPAQNGGCPVATATGDSDGDGIMDTSDKCPKEPETKNGFQDDDGCPDEVPAAVASFSGSIEGVVFKTGSPELDAKSFPVLSKAAAVFKQYPDVRVEIAGHTDDVGNAEKNTVLSQKRAESVKSWFTKNGIDAKRLEAKGYGPTKPVTGNDTPAGRGKNRRVEFHLIQ